VHELGGNFEVTSDESGTVIRASVPLAVREESPAVQAEAAS